MQGKQQDQLAHFLDKYQQGLSKQVRQTKRQDIRARILTQNQLETASQQLNLGQLVAFPTETVYGLGANAYDEGALRKIYQTKKRPLTDPIIVHVLNAEEGRKLVIMNEPETKLYELLAKQFWPGPLTMILKADLELLPLIVTAQTGFVGIRVPKHPFARKLIQASKLPIGAPSANLFSHVSPTQPVHVFNDFYDCQISIVDGERCQFGVQSTVVKIVEGEIHVFRQGSLSVNNLQSYLKKCLPDNELPAVIVHKKVQNKHTNMQAPGQLLKHYAPYLPCYILDDNELSKRYINSQSKQEFQLQNAAFISFSKQRFSGFQSSCKFYFEVGQNLQVQINERQQEQEMFCSKEEKLRMRQIYYLLRKCQNLSADAIVIGWGESKEGTVWDKIYRSTQGRIVVALK